MLGTAMSFLSHGASLCRRDCTLLKQARSYCITTPAHESAVLGLHSPGCRSQKHKHN